MGRQRRLNPAWVLFFLFHLMAGVRRKKERRKKHSKSWQFLDFGCLKAKPEKITIFGGGGEILNFHFGGFLLKCHLVELFCFWGNLSMHCENFKLILGCSLPLRALTISFDLSLFLLSTSILADAFFHSYSCSTKIATTETVKMAMRHFLPGWTSWGWDLCDSQSYCLGLTELPPFHTFGNWKVFVVQCRLPPSLLIHGKADSGTGVFHMAHGGQSGRLDLYLCWLENHSDFAITEVQLPCWHSVLLYFRAVK